MFCQRGKEVVKSMDALLESFHQPTAGSRVVINLGVFLFVRQTGILPVINEFFSKNHNVVGNLKIVDNREGEDMLRNRRLDFAILKVADDGMTFSDLEYEKLFSEQLYVLMSRNNQLAGNKNIRHEELSSLRILGIRKNGYTVTMPDANMLIEEDDIMWLIGSNNNVGIMAAAAMKSRKS